VVRTGTAGLWDCGTERFGTAGLRDWKPRDWETREQGSGRTAESAELAALERQPEGGSRLPVAGR
jgi:hypothetical protein